MEHSLWNWTCSSASSGFSPNQAYKPSSVPGTCPGDDHLSRAPVARRLKRPTRERGRAVPARSLTVRPPVRSCSRWGLPRPTGHPAAGELLPHHFTLTRPYGRRRYVSVALSLGSPPLGVTQHHGSVELGLSSYGDAARGRPAWLRHGVAYHVAPSGSTSALLCYVSARGRVKLNSLPWPTTLCTVIAPFICSTSCLEMNNPMPVPT